jgi:hypothetical protein
VDERMTNVQLQSCKNGVPDGQTQDGGAEQEIENWDKVLTPSQIHSLIQFNAMDEENDTVARYLQRSKKHVYSFWPKGEVPDALCNRIRTDERDYSDIPKKEFDWECTCYSGAEEQVPEDAPRPLGKPITMTHYVR